VEVVIDRIKGGLIVLGLGAAGVTYIILDEAIRRLHIPSRKGR
jgi:hypothetical protein